MRVENHGCGRSLRNLKLFPVVRTIMSCVGGDRSDCQALMTTIAPPYSDKGADFSPG